MVRAVLAVLCTILRCVSAQAAAAGVKVWEDRIVLPTYAEEAPDPNPDLSVFNAADLPAYPYALRSQFSEKKRNESWRTLNLENEYLSCRVLPDLGGHLYNCLDKISNREVFYANPVVRKGKEGQRGSWVAMGIESNFPVGHGYTSTSPVNFATREDADGASIVVGNIDRITGMEWTVEYRLRPASAVLEERVTLYNRSSVRHRYYWWANAAIEYDDRKMKAIYPTRVMSVHETGDLIPWPYGPDRMDLSVIANHTAGHGFFAYGSREPFMAIYKPGSRTGVAHFSDTGAVGKKLWLWGPEGDNHVKTTLTSRFNSYVEMQAGLFQNQTQFAFLNPQEVRRFTEYWIPFREMKGLSRANPNAAVFLERRKNNSELVVQVMATGPQPSARLEVTCGKEQILDAAADLGPQTVFTKEVATTSPAPCRLRVSSRTGATLIEHTEDRYDFGDLSTVKLGKQPEQSWIGPATEAFLGSRAAYNELTGHLRLAWQDYTAALEQAPSSFPLHKGAGRLAVVLGRAADARRHEAAALSGNPDDEEAAYYLGVSLCLLGQDAEARSAFAQVKAGSPLFYAAQLQLASIAARSGDLKAAIEFSNRMTDQNSGSMAGAVQVALLRRAGQKEAAAAQLARWFPVNPSDLMLRFEHLQIEGGDDGFWAHLAGDPERILDLVDIYLSLGFYDSALQILEHKYPEVPANQVELGSQPPEHHPLLLYYRAYCRMKSGTATAADWNAASHQSLAYVFPNRLSSYPVLSAALAQNGHDAVAHYLLGLLYMNSLEDSKAIQEWQEARALLPGLPGLHRNLGKALLELKHDPAAAVAVFKEGVRVEKENGDLQSEVAKATEALTASPTTKGSATPSAGTQLAVAAMLKAASGSVPEAVAAFQDGQFAATDQPDEVRQAFIEVQLQRLISLAQSKKCDEALDGMDSLGTGTGQPAFAREGLGRFIRYPHFQYYLGVVEARCGREKAARKRWSRIVAGKERLPAAESVFPYVAAAMVNREEAKDETLKALQAVQVELGKPENAGHSWLLFAEGILLRAAGQQQEGLEMLKRTAAITTDPLAQYLSKTELNLAGR